MNFSRESTPPPPPRKSFRSNYLAYSLLLAAIFLYGCNPPSESSSPPAKPGGINKGTTTDTNNPDVKKVTDAAAFKMTESITYYTVNTTEDVQIKHTTIAPNITGDVSWEVTKVGTSTQVGHISNISGIKANATDANQLDIPQDTVGFFYVEVSAKGGTQQNSGEILLAAGSIAIPSAVIAMQSTAATGITVDTTKKTVSITTGSAGATFTVGGLDVSKFAKGVPKYALAYSAEGMGAGKLARAINPTTGEVTLGSGADRAEIAIKVSGKAPYKTLTATTLYTLKPPTYTTTVRGLIVTPARFQDATKGSVIPTAEVWASTDTNTKTKVKTDGSYELEVANHPGTFTIIANYTGADGKYKQGDPQTVTTTSSTHSQNIPLKYGRTAGVNGTVTIFPGGAGSRGRGVVGVKVIVEVEGVQVAEGVTSSTVAGAEYDFANVPHNGRSRSKQAILGQMCKINLQPTIMLQTEMMLIKLLI